MANTLRCIFAGAFVMLASGCANEHAVFRNSTIGGTSPRIITEDAKQRNVHISPTYALDANKKAYITQYRICAEASPDVFSALSASASADLGLARSAGNADTRVAAAIAIAESAATIERTQTVNLLRESMYRTCERYMSGAITKEAFIVQAGRDWRAMIAILAIEQLTRTARPASAILIAPSTNSVITSPSELATELTRAARDAKAAEIQSKAADKAVTDKACASVPAKKDGEDAAITTKRDECKTLEGNKAAAAEELQKAEAARDALRDVLSKSAGVGTQTGSSTGAATGSSGGGSLQGQATATADLAAVSAVVQTITLQALNTDETQLFCLQSLASTSAADPEMKASCLDYLKKKVTYEANWYSQSAATGAATANPDTAALAQKLGDYLSAPGGTPSAKWSALVSNAGIPPGEVAKLISQGVDVPSMQAAFKNQFIDTQRKIVAKIP